MLLLVGDGEVHETWSVNDGRQGRAPGYEANFGFEVGVHDGVPPRRRVYGTCDWVELAVLSVPPRVAYCDVAEAAPVFVCVSMTCHDSP